MVVNCTIYPIKTPVKADGINRNIWLKGSDQNPKCQQSKKKHILHGKCRVNSVAWIVCIQNTCPCPRHLWAWTQWVVNLLSLWAQTQTRYFKKLCCGVTGSNFCPELQRMPMRLMSSVPTAMVTGDPNFEFNKNYCTTLYAWREWMVFCTQPIAFEFRSAQPQPWRPSERAHEPERHHQWPQQCLYPSSSLHEQSDVLSSLEE